MISSVLHRLADLRVRPLHHLRPGSGQAWRCSRRSVAQYHDVTPPTVLVTTPYPGVEQRTSQRCARHRRGMLETEAAERPSGVEGDDATCSSQCNNDGVYNLTRRPCAWHELDMRASPGGELVSLAQPVIPAPAERRHQRQEDIVPNTMVDRELQISPDGRMTARLQYNKCDDGDRKRRIRPAPPAGINGPVPA